MSEADRKPLFNLYIDDSGTRHPDLKGEPDRPLNWFALGGVLIKAEDDEPARDLHRSFCGRWNITYPLHSVKIRGSQDNFGWLKTCEPDERNAFFTDMSATIAAMPVIGHACVIDRPGYSGRYRERYGRQQWSLCKTAFSVICERAAKFAIMHDRRVRVFVERSDKAVDNTLKGYFRDMRDTGMPFSKDGSDKYGPLSPEELKYRLLDLTFKTKECRMTQMADIMLYPMCRGAYEKDYRPFRHMQEHGKVVDLHLDEDQIGNVGIKYSCFERYEGL